MFQSIFLEAWKKGYRSSNHMCSTTKPWFPVLPYLAGKTGYFCLICELRIYIKTNVRNQNTKPHF
jgi:hypothetical protein